MSLKRGKLYDKKQYKRISTRNNRYYYEKIAARFKRNFYRNASRNRKKHCNQVPSSIVGFKKSNISNILLKLSFDYIILNDIENMQEEEYIRIYQARKKAKIICFCDRNQRIKESGKWLDKKTMDYSLVMQKVINEGYINPNYVGYKFECFVEKLIKKFT